MIRIEQSTTETSLHVDTLVRGMPASNVSKFQQPGAPPLRHTRPSVGRLMGSRGSDSGQGHW
eukprot:3605867-Alexandrium_andersonii.AAC.1